MFPSRDNNMVNLTKEQLAELIKIISTHKEGEGQFCDTGEDMEWGCRSKCVELAIQRLKNGIRYI